MLPQRCLLAHLEATLAHNISQICYCGQISLQSAAVNCSFSHTFGGNIYFAADGTRCRQYNSTIVILK